MRLTPGPGLSLCGLVVFVAGCVGCASFANGTSAAMPQVRERASYELDCPDEDLRVKEEFGGWFVAVGCAKKARYRAACDGLRCVVHGESEGLVPWRDRPPPGDVVTR